MNNARVLLRALFVLFTFRFVPVVGHLFDFNPSDTGKRQQHSNDEFIDDIGRRCANPVWG